MYSDAKTSPLRDADRIFGLDNEALDLVDAGRFDERAYRRILGGVVEAHGDGADVLYIHQQAFKVGLIPSLASVLKNTA